MFAVHSHTHTHKHTKVQLIGQDATGQAQFDYDILCMVFFVEHFKKNQNQATVAERRRQWRENPFTWFFVAYFFDICSFCYYFISVCMCQVVGVSFFFCSHCANFFVGCHHPWSFANVVIANVYCLSAPSSPIPVHKFHSSPHLFPSTRNACPQKKELTCVSIIWNQQKISRRQFDTAYIWSERKMCVETL